MNWFTYTFLAALGSGLLLQIWLLLRHRNHMFRHWARLEQKVTGEAQPPDESDRSVLSDAEMNDKMPLMSADRVKDLRSLVKKIDKAIKAKEQK